MWKIIQVLFVDDEQKLLEQAKIFLEKEDDRLCVTVTNSAVDALELLFIERFDLLIADYKMPEMNGLELLEKIRKKMKLDIPFIIFTGKGREEVAIKALNLGANRYIKKGGDPKSQYRILFRTILQEVKHHRTEKELRLTKYSVDKASQGIFWVTPGGEFIYTNEHVSEMLGFTEKELKGMHVWDIDPKFSEEFRDEYWNELKKEGVKRIETVHRTKNDELIPVEIHSNYIEHDDVELEFAFVKEISKDMILKGQEEDENDLHELFQMVNDGLIILEDDKYVECNKKTLEMFNRKRDDFIGKTPYDLSPSKQPDGRDSKISTKKWIEKAYDGEDLIFEWLHKKKGGKLFYVEVSLKAAHWKEKTYLIATLRDITDRKKIEERFRKREERFKRLHAMSYELEEAEMADDICKIALKAADDILDLSESIIFLVDESGGLVPGPSSKKVIEDEIMSPFTEENIINKTFTNNESLLIEDLNYENKTDSLEDRNNSSKFLIKEKSNELGVKYRSAISIPIDNQGVFLGVSTKPHNFDKEDLEMGELLMSHISLALKRIRRMEKEDFLHSLLRHDIKNKIQIVKGYLQLSKDILEDDKLKSFINNSEIATDECIDIIERVRMLRNIEKEKIREVDIISVIEEVIDLEKRMSDDIRYEMIINTDERPKVNGGQFLKELFSNIVENSARHSEGDNIRVKVENRVEEVLCVVEDDGKGIPDEMKNKVFEKGFKKGKNAGLGLGLYMVKEIAQNYNGKVEIKDSDLGGARFVVRLERL